MRRQWVVNASPIIVLAKAGQQALLRELADELVIPRAVAEEVAAGPVDDPAVAWLKGSAQGWVREDMPVPPVVSAWDLGAGETAVLAWAYHQRQFEAIVDDRAARSCAKALGVSVRGTIGVVLLAKRSGRLPAARPVLEAIVAAGYRIDRRLLAHALGLAGE